MDRTRTNGFIGWQSNDDTIRYESRSCGDNNGFIGRQSNDDTSTWGWTNWAEVPIRSTFPDPEYRNGQRLKKGEQRPTPFWRRYCDEILPAYNKSITNYNKSILNFRICGAYSRHDKPRKFRKKRLF